MFHGEKLFPICLSDHPKPNKITVCNSRLSRTNTAALDAYSIWRQQEFARQDFGKKFPASQNQDLKLVKATHFRSPSRYMARVDIRLWRCLFLCLQEDPILDQQLMTTRVKLRQMYSKQRSTWCRDVQTDADLCRLHDAALPAHGGLQSSFTGSASCTLKSPMSSQGTLALAQHLLDVAALLEGTSEHHTSLSQPLGPTASDVMLPSARLFKKIRI